MKICIVSFDYPDQDRNIFPFVKQLVDEFANQGHECYVIAPYSITKNRKIWRYKEHIRKGVGSITIIRPNYISASNVHFGKYYVTDYLHKKAIRRAFKQVPKDIDCIYAHFWKSALEVAPYAMRNNIPLFVATGESVIPLSNIRESYAKYYDYISGVICVSSKNRDESIDKGLTTRDKCIVIPNAINAQVFYPRDKMKCRLELNLPSDAFIVTTVGWYSLRKGTKMLSRALDQIKDSTVHSMFIGEGPDKPTCKNILYMGSVAHNDIPKYLSASDVFILPTLNEGCCNAIIEAMACGLPIVSSDLSFNYDILNHENSILVDPQNVTELVNAINRLNIDSELRSRLGYLSLETASTLTIGNRAKSIIHFISSRLDHK